uniref:Ig-like domain-containing protein n=1 Tax=Kryptolebias marmoratus TaxID=37003 RepID=A0A3Q3BJ75_KRYMA
MDHSSYFFVLKLASKTQLNLHFCVNRLQVVKGLEDVEVSECEACSLEVTLNLAYIEGMWTRDGMQLKSRPSCRISMHGKKHALILTRVALEDGGLYTFQANGVQTSGRLSVRGNPLQLPVYMMMPDNTPVTWAPASPRLKLQYMVRSWKEQIGLDLLKSKPGYLIAFSFTDCISQSHNRCHFAILFLNIFTDLHITIIQRMKTTSVHEGESCTFECHLSHNVDDEPTWSINGHVMVTNGHIQLVNNGYVVFTIKDLKKPVHIFRDVMNVKAVPGEDAELSCEITKPEATIHWRKNGHLIRQSPKYIMSVEKNLARLVIKNATIKDSGEYCCEAEGVASRLHVFTLPERRPTIIKALEDCEAIEGGGLVLSCVTSKPCHIIWYKDGCMMWHSSRYFTSRSDCEARLTIREVSNSDAGVYECSAGSVTTRAVVTVKVKSLLILVFFLAIPAEFTQLLKAVEAKEGEAVTLTCEYSLPGVQFHWRKEQLENGEKYQIKQRDSILDLTIIDAAPEDSGVYTCVCREPPFDTFTREKFNFSNNNMDFCIELLSTDINRLHCVPTI